MPGSETERATMLEDNVPNVPISSTLERLSRGLGRMEGASIPGKLQD